jgi:hypothetical protein
VYLGDLERLQDIQIKRDKTNRDWQRIILRNVGKSLGWDMDVEDDGISTESDGPLVLETRQLWWHVHNKMQNPEYGNMLLLAKMEDWLEEIMFQRGQKYMTKSAYEKMVCRVTPLDDSAVGLTRDLTVFVIRCSSDQQGPLGCRRPGGGAFCETGGTARSRSTARDFLRTDGSRSGGGVSYQMIRLPRSSLRL